MVMSLSRRALVALCALLVAIPAFVGLLAQPAAAATTSQLASSLISKINAIRAAHHWAQLRVDSRLVNRAATHNALAAWTGQLAQSFYGEASVATRLLQLGYHSAAAGQVLGAATTQAGVVRLAYDMGWDNRRHTVYAATGYSNIGVGVQWSAKRRAYVVTVIVARPVVTLQQEAAARVLATLNAERAAHRLPALTMDSRLVASAHRHNLVMAASNVLSHQLPGEASLGPRILSTGYRYYYGGENVAWTTDRSVAGLVNVHVAMYNEVPPNDGHRQNILSPNYRNVGIDVVIDAAHGKAWITEDFGRLQ